MQRTPLYEAHRAAGGRLVDFAGWDMPMQYSGVVDEYYAVRRAAGVFDVSHMGRMIVRGDDALALLQYVTTNDVAKLGVLESQYSMVCNPAGGIKDDIFVYRLEADEYWLCVNASNRVKILDWLLTQGAGRAVEVLDQSSAMAQLALQGPRSQEILERLGVAALSTLKPRRCLHVKISGIQLVVTRTGYTGELGYELYVPAGDVTTIWHGLLQVGKELGLKPAGLGARDLLRLDMDYLLYGNDISEETTLVEAGAEWIVSMDKGEFVGREALVAQQRQGCSRRLIAFELHEKAVPRHGCRILASPDAAQIGEVTSGNLSPILQKGIGLGYVPSAVTEPGTRLLIDIRGKHVPAGVVKPPFYRRKAQ